MKELLLIKAERDAEREARKHDLARIQELREALGKIRSVVGTSTEAWKIASDALAKDAPIEAEKENVCT